MTQNIVNYANNPDGPELLDDYLAKQQQNELTTNSGIQRPSYAVAGTKWLDTSSTPWVWKMFDGTSDIILGSIDPTTHAFSAAGLDTAVLLTGDQTVGGTKTFSNNPLVPNVSSGDSSSKVANTAFVTTGLATKQNTLTAGRNIVITGNEISSTADSRHIGEIIQSTIPLIDAGLHLLDGSLIDGTGIYKDFYDYIVSLYNDYPQIFADEQGWQQDVTNFGVCGKFVFDTTNKTVRLPLIKGFIEGTNDLSVLDHMNHAGLPNITGSFSRIMYKQDVPLSLDGAFQTTESGGGGGYSTGSNLGNLSGDFDASRSSSIYGNSSTVQPQSIKVLYYIVIATSTKTDIQVDIDEIATDLNNKVDKNDLATVHCVIETYQNGSSWYRVYDDGWCEQGGFMETGAGRVTVNLLKPYRDTAYSVQITSSADNNTSGHTQHVIHRHGGNNTSYFQTSLCEYYGTNTFVGYWETKGYIS